MNEWLGLTLIRFRTWIGDTVERCREKDEVGRYGIIISVLVAWFVMSMAMQSLILIIVKGLMGSSLDTGGLNTLIGEVAPVSSVLAYLPILALLPFIRSKLFSSPLLALPSTSRNTRLSRILRAIGFGAASAVVLFIGVQIVGAVANALQPTLRSSSTTRSMSIMIVGVFNGDERWPWLVVLDLVCAAVLAPLMEELMFRVVVASEVYDSTFATVILGDGSRKRTWLRTLMATLVSGLIFAVMHVMTTDPSQALLILLTTWFMGSFLSWLTCVACRSAWPGIIGHCLYNVMVIGIGVIVL